VIYYLQHILQTELKVAPEALPIQIINFKEGIFQHWQGGSILKDGEKLPGPTTSANGAERRG
jgi:hypothetical protein